MGGLVLHGYPVSNWFNCARAAMIELGLGSDFTVTRAASDDGFLANSAMGKIPWLETGRGGLAETVAILEYLEETAGPLLMPTDAFERARVRQVFNIVQVYVELPMRSLYPAVFMGEQVGPDAAGAAFAMTERAMRALDQLCACDPFLCGNTLTIADLAAFYVFELADRVCFHFRRDGLLSRSIAFKRWRQVMQGRESTMIVLADFAPAFAQYRAAKGAAFDEEAYQTQRKADA